MTLLAYLQSDSALAALDGGRRDAGLLDYANALNLPVVHGHLTMEQLLLRHYNFCVGMLDMVKALGDGLLTGCLRRVPMFHIARIVLLSADTTLQILLELVAARSEAQAADQARYSSRPYSLYGALEAARRIHSRHASFAAHGLVVLRVHVILIRRALQARQDQKILDRVAS